MNIMHKRVLLLLSLLACFVLFGLQGDSQVSAALDRGGHQWDDEIS